MENSFNNRLLSKCKQVNNRLCIGLDVDPDKLPSYISNLKSVESFTKEIIDSTIDFCPVYKPNFAFYERFGSKGFVLLENIVQHIGNRAITIADAKRGDIGNTSRHYADSIFKIQKLDFDALLPGHLQISLNNGKSHVNQAADYFRKLGIPPNIV